MSRHETPGDIIASLTARHSQDGYTSYSALCDALSAALQAALTKAGEMQAALDRYTGKTKPPEYNEDAGDFEFTVTLHGAYLPAIGSYEDSPYEGEHGTRWVLFNGAWVSPYYVASDDQVSSWDLDAARLGEAYMRRERDQRLIEQREAA